VTQENEEALKQAAILLLNLGEEQAAKVLKHLDPKQVEKLIGYMNKVGSVRDHDVVSALNHFFTESTDANSIGMNSANFIRNSLTTAVGTEKAISILDHAAITEQYKGIETLRWQTPELIADILQDEHPQVLAITLTYLDSEKAANTLKLLSKELRLSILKRVTNIGPLSPIALQELSAVLEELLIHADHFRMLPIGGVETTANIVNLLDTELETEILNSLTETDEILANQIQDRMFPFEKLATLDPRSLQTLLRDVSNDELTLALKGVDHEIQATFFKNISARAAEMLKDDLEALGAVQLSKVIEAQKKIIIMAKKLGDEGKIVLGSKSNGDMIP
jgi:flagellar motor switch protein FliG